LPSEKTGPSPLNGINALVVEDECLISIMIEQMLRDLGCADVWTASDTSQAQEILRARRPDVAVVDVNLAGESTGVVAEQLEAAQIPFVFATGYGRHGVPERWSSKLVVQKPFAFEALAAAVRAALSATSKGPRA
jgi:CheY-like chemotaxis protein